MTTPVRRPINAIRVTVRSGVTAVSLMTSTRLGRRSPFRTVEVLQGEEVGEVVLKLLESELSKDDSTL